MLLLGALSKAVTAYLLETYPDRFGRCIASKELHLLLRFGYLLSCFACLLTFLQSYGKQ